MKPRKFILVAFLALAMVVFGMACNNTTTDTTTSSPTTSATISVPTASVATSSTTSATTSSTTSATPSTTTSASGGSVLEKAPLPLQGPNHTLATAAMCGFCHMAGTGPNSMPIAPSWTGSAETPGNWTIVADSPADHTGRSDPAGCVIAGCHAKSW